MLDPDNVSEGMRVEIIGGEHLNGNERVGKITSLSGRSRRCCVVLFDDGVEDVLSYNELKLEQD